MTDEPTPDVVASIIASVESIPEDFKIRSVRSVHCRHHSSVVDVGARTVVCASCKVALDPIKVIYSLCHEHDSLLRVREELLEKQKEHAALSIEIRKLKSARNALVRRAPK